MNLGVSGFGSFQLQYTFSYESCAESFVFFYSAYVSPSDLGAADDTSHVQQDGHDCRKTVAQGHPAGDPAVGVVRLETSLIGRNLPAIAPKAARVVANPSMSIQMSWQNFSTEDEV